MIELLLGSAIIVAFVCECALVGWVLDGDRCDTFWENATSGLLTQLFLALGIIIAYGVGWAVLS